MGTGEGTMDGARDTVGAVVGTLAKVPSAPVQNRPLAATPPSMAPESESESRHESGDSSDSGLAMSTK